MVELNKVYCGDCLELMKDIPNNYIDLVLTDIPYNISQKSGGLRKLDYGDWDKQKGMEEKWIKGMERLVKKSIIVFCGKTQFGLILDYLLKKDYLVKPVVWCKPNPTVLNSDKMMIEGTEFAVFGKKRRATWNTNYQLNYFNETAPINRIHPTQKPISIFKRLIKITTNPGDIILDPFMGSGTTAVACKKLERNFIGCEISQDYVDIANARLQKVVAVSNDIEDDDIW